MVVDESARHGLRNRLDQVLGPEEATTLMSLLPPVGWADVATKHDLDSLGRELRAEIAQLRTELHGQIGQLRGDLQGEIAQLRGELHGETGELRGEMGQMRAEFHRDLGVLTRTLVISMLTTVIAVGGLAFGAATLI